MTIVSRHIAPIPRCSLQQWIFGSSQEPLSDKRLLIDADRPDTHFISKSDYRLLSKRIALGLQDAGLEAGDRMLLFSSNDIYFPPIFVGTLMAGGIFSGANPSYVARELAYQLRDSGAKFVITAANSLATTLEAADAVGLPHDRIYVLDAVPDPPSDVVSTENPPKQTLPDGGASGVRHWLDLLQGNHRRALVWDWVEPTDPATTTCALNYSSGTTGMPKGVEISHHSYVANCESVVSVGRNDPEIVAARQRTVGLCFLPMYHAYGQTYFIAIMAQMEIPAYIMGKFDFIKFLDHIQKFRVTTLSLVPPIAVALSKHPIVKKYDLSSVEAVSSGAAPLASESVAALRKLWPNAEVPVRQGWGMTEVTCTCLTWTADTDAGDGSVGELGANYSARLVAVDEGGGSGSPKYITEANKPGELWVTGPTLMRGYWRNPKATEETIHVDADGTRWLKTGDIAYVNRYATGAGFFIVDRRKELIKVKGNQVAPAELEAVLIERSDVVDTAVIGVAVYGEERPRAYIVRAAGSKATGEDIAKWMAARVAPFKRLTGGVVFVDEIPKNPSGKILRKILRDQASKERSSKL
ncbi:uncharacterized protein SPSK_08924 [Sporothrix schenckii 1099-18]|uniref:4-coumarate-CoA ligase n=2 Tax=Sporothrix schenckii TaxID=29908 RepID=U7Q8J2_SPOS1|nr:uncharacterized protein SPSK_08924 [Sporothrix schenckii 1099-18]ERT03076.1 hypothetical protein HMPREF1624_01381 [Sporothrix schenckii ATCC 58251]KJR84523.1 hypothetical protein SPSK_08924 [Sporothrix schenckii 1099-18]